MGEEISSGEPLTETEKLDLAKMNILERKFLLQTIPNGKPLDPFKGYSSVYGTREHPILEKQIYHYGLDFKGTKGTKIISPADGIIEFAPFKGYSSVYGTREHPILEKQIYHYGLDFKGTKGTKIISPADGIIEFAGYNSGGFGNLVIMDHGYGFKTYYAHMSKIDVKVGQVVRKGQKLGEVGSTGRSTGPHLHYEIHYLGKRVNPMSFTEWNIDNYNSLFEKEKGVKWQSLVEMIKHQTQAFQERK